MDIHDYFGVLRRGWTLIALGIILGLVGGALAQQWEEPLYSATSREYVEGRSTGAADINDTVQASGLAAGRVPSYVLVATTGLVLQPVIDELSLNLSVDQLAEQLRVVSPPDTVIIEITATAATPTLARDIANAVSSSLRQVVTEQLEPEPEPVATPTPLPSLDANGTPIPELATVVLRVVNLAEAELPLAPNAAVGPFFLAIGAIVGLGIGLVGASLREALDRRVRTRRDVAVVTPVPVIGLVRWDRSMRSENIDPAARGTGKGGGKVPEPFRALRTALEHLRARDGRSAFVVTTMDRSRGATSITANVAIAMAKASTAVVVVDANLANPELTRVMGAQNTLGLTDFIAGRATLEEVLRPGPHGTRVLGVGTNSGAPREFLATAAMKDLIERLSARFEVVLIDAPATPAGTEATVLGSFGCATLLVVPVGAVTRPRLEETLVALATGGQVPAGIILNHAPRRMPGRRVARPEVAAAIVKSAKSPKAVKTRRPPVVKPKPETLAPLPQHAPFQPPPIAAEATADAQPKRDADDEGATPSGPITKIPFQLQTPAATASRARMIEPPRPVTALPEPPAKAPSSNVTPMNAALSRERKAQESYLQRSRELERVAAERRAREQLASVNGAQPHPDRRDVFAELEGDLEDTVIVPRARADS